MADNKEMKTLGGYEIVDEKARQDIHAVSEKADEALSLAKGATKAFVYDTYSDMISELNALDKAELLVNYHVMIRTVCVPDLWISGVSDEHVEYTYTSNEDFIVDLTEDGIVQVGYFVLSALETQKVELDDYVKNDDYATSTKAGVVKTNYAWGVNASADGGLSICKALDTEIDGKVNTTKPIVPSNLDYAVMKALSDSKLEWTEEQKQLARALLGVPLVNSNYGIGLRDNTLMTVMATKGDINNKSNSVKAITPNLLDYAVKKALSDCKLSGDDVWTDEEKILARTLLGAIGSEDYATKDKAGVLKISDLDYGVRLDANGYLEIREPSDWNILNARNNGGKSPVTLSKVDLTVKEVLKNPRVEWSDEEKAKALESLGIVLCEFGTPIQGRVAVLGSGGQLSVGTPTMYNSATTKKYVDDLVCSTKDSIALKDASTGQVYNIRINNGVLEMVLVDEEVE